MPGKAKVAKKTEKRPAGLKDTRKNPDPVTESELEDDDQFDSTEEEVAQMDKVGGENEIEDSEADVEEEGSEDGQPAKKKRKATSAGEAGSENPELLSRAERKALRHERKVAKPQGDVVYEAKKLWEKIRVRTLDPEARTPLMEKVIELVKGKVVDIIFKHDASRVIQTLIKYGTDEQREMIANELKGHYVELSKSLYGKFIVLKLLKYLPSHRRKIIPEFFTHVTKLLRQTHSRTVVSTIYAEYAVAYERNSLISEFYGPEFVIFKDPENTKTLAQIVADVKTSFKKPMILKNMKTHIEALLNKATTDMTNSVILHRVILEFLSFATPKDIDAMIPLLKDHVIHILHTREGSLVGRKVILNSTAKDRKYVLKTFKSFIKKAGLEQYGHSVLIAALEYVDDTTLLNKTFAELGEDDIVELAKDKFGSRVLLHALCGRNKRYQPISLIKELESEDEVKKERCKKDNEIREREIRNGFGVAIMKTLAETDKLNEVMRVKEGREVVVEAVNAIEDSSDLMDAIVALIASSPVQITQQEEKEEWHPVKALAAERAAESDQSEPVIDLTTHILLHRVSSAAIKILIKTNPAFAKKCHQALRDGAWNEGSLLEYWIKTFLGKKEESNSLGFVIVALVECGDEEVAKDVTQIVKSLIQTNNVARLKKEKSKKDKNEEKGNKRKRGDDGEKKGKGAFDILVEKCC